MYKSAFRILTKNESNNNDNKQIWVNNKQQQQQQIQIETNTSALTAIESSSSSITSIQSSVSMSPFSSPRLSLNSSVVSTTSSSATSDNMLHQNDFKKINNKKYSDSINSSLNYNSNNNNQLRQQEKVFDVLVAEDIDVPFDDQYNDNNFNNTKISTIINSNKLIKLNNKNSNYLNQNNIHFYTCNQPKTNSNCIHHINNRNNSQDSFYNNLQLASSSSSSCHLCENKNILNQQQQQQHIIKTPVPIVQQHQLSSIKSSLNKYLNRSSFIPISKTLQPVCELSDSGYNTNNHQEFIDQNQPLFITESTIDLPKRAILNRSNSCQNSKLDKSNLNLRRKRNLTTSFNRPNNNNNNHILNRDYCLDKFLDSLEDINSYLDKKLSQIENLEQKQSQQLQQQQQQQKQSIPRKSRRYFTQPIILFSSKLQNNNNKPKEVEEDELGSYEEQSTLIKNFRNNNKARSNSNINNNHTKNTISNKYHDDEFNNLVNLAKMNETNKINTKNDKKFVSLSDILTNNENHNNNNNSNNVINKQTGAQLVSNANLPKNKQNELTSSLLSSDLNELLTVQELFEELKLDCDEQIKQLDKLESERKENAKLQKKIIDQLNYDSLNFKKFKSTQQQQQLKRASTSQKCKCYFGKRRKEFRLKLSYFKPKLNRLFNIVYYVNDKKFYFILIKKKKLWKNFLNLKNSKFLLSINESDLSIGKKSLKFLEFYYKTSKNFIKNDEFKLLNKNSNELSSTTTTASSSFNLPVIKMNYESLLTVQNDELVNETKVLKSDTTSEYSSCSNSSLPSSQILRRKKTNEFNSSRAEKIKESNRKANMIINENSILKNQEFISLVDSSKWLIEAGYSQIVHSILKEKCKNSIDFNHSLTNNINLVKSNQSNLDKTFQQIKKEHPHLQEYDLRAIQRRLNVLHTTTSILNIDYKDLIENFLNIDEEDEDQEEEEEEYDENEQEEEQDNSGYSQNEPDTPENNVTQSSNSNDDTDDIISNLSSLTKTKPSKYKPIYLNEDLLSLNSTTDNHYNHHNIKSLRLEPLNTTNIQMSYSKEFKNISPVSPNKFVCIEFPLNNQDLTHRQSLYITPSTVSSSITSADSSTTTPNNQRSQMSRFHSFRLDDKLNNSHSHQSASIAATPTTAIASVVTSNLAQNSNLSKSYLDLTNPSLTQNDNDILFDLKQAKNDLNNNSIKISNNSESQSLDKSSNSPNSLSSLSSQMQKQVASGNFYSSSIETSSPGSSSTTSTPSSPPPDNKISIQQQQQQQQTSIAQPQTQPNKPKSRTATVVISLRKSIKRNSKKLTNNNKNEDHSPENIKTISYEPNLPKIEIKNTQLNSVQNLVHIPILNEINTVNSVDINNNTNSKRERRDSGVGGSLTREASKRREKWGSFVKSHRPSFKSSKLQISTLTVKQYSKLKNLSLVRITALMEKYTQSGQKSGWNRFKTVPKFIKRHQKSLDQGLYKNKVVFGVPLKLNFQRHGQPLPQSIIQVMKYLRKNALNTIGIFRKSGSKFRMNIIRELIERSNQFSFSEIEKQFNLVNLNTSTDLNSIGSVGSGLSSQSTSKSDLIAEDYNTERILINAEIMCIDLADILKQYFRELPECLFTNKLSQTLIDIFTYLPETERLDAVQYCMMLLDDENRDAIQCLLYFLHDISRNSEVHKMDARNIAICLAPTLLNMNNLKEITTSMPTSPQPSHNFLIKDHTQLMSRQCNASLECLTLMIENPKKVFQIPNEAINKCQFTKSDYSITLTLNELLAGECSQSSLINYLDDRVKDMFKELKDKPRNWSRLRNESNVEIFYKTIDDEYNLLRLWKLSVEIDASPNDVRNRIIKSRSQWDEDLVESRLIENLTPHIDINQYVMHFMPPQPTRDFCELRYWNDASSMGSKYSYSIYSTSIEHEKANLLGDIRASTLRNFYLIEILADNKCKLHQLYRGDYMGYSSEWYNKMQAHFLKRNLINLKESFQTKL